MDLLSKQETINKALNTEIQRVQHEINSRLNFLAEGLSEEMTKHRLKWVKEDFVYLESLRSALV